MKHFFYVLFGGLAAIGCGILGAYLVSFGWQIIRPPVIHPNPSVSIVTDSVPANPAQNAESIAVSTPTVRYTADEEENMIDSAAASLPKSSKSGITAPAYELRDLTTGTVVMQHNAERLMPIASLTKLVTAVIARKFILSDARITITHDVMATYGNTAQFRAGETFTAHDLLYPLLMVSSNDAAEAYAQYYGRGDFIRAMNSFTQSIGAYRTYFADPSGLSPENVSTADDMGIILNWIHAHDPEILDTTLLKSITMRSHTWVNVVHSLNWSYYRGGKNGYTTEANSTAAQLFIAGKNKDLYSITVLGSSSRVNDIVLLLSLAK